MKGSVEKTSWLGYSGYKLENEAVKVLVVPELGGRIVSLLDKAMNYEWLVAPRQAHSVKKVDYGADYNSNQSGGWDEMLPTIVAGPYPAAGAYQGSALPDHGELWALPWSDAGSDQERLALTATGRTLPFRLTRTLLLTECNDLTFEYTLENLGAETLVWLWAAHPQFVCEAGARVVMPPEVQRVIQVQGGPWGEPFGAVGARLPWPLLPVQENFMFPLDTISGVEAKRGRKIYVPPEVSINWAGLLQPRSNCWLRLDWDVATLPYCGVWFDEGALNKAPTIAIEPTNGFYDSLETAYSNERLGRLAAGERCSWKLSLRVGHGGKV
jgi:galactose mutarotase-like enzyme